MIATELAAIDRRVALLSIPPSPSLLVAHPSSPLSLSSEVGTFRPLSAIHPHLLDILRTTSPTLLARVSRAFYDDLIPTIYRDVSLTEQNVWKVLEGVKRERKGAALGFVRDLEVGLDALQALARGRPSDSSKAVELQVTSDSHSYAPWNLAPTDLSPLSPIADHQTVPPDSARTQLQPLFSQVKRLHLPWPMIDTLSSQIAWAEGRSDGVSDAAETSRGSADPSDLSQVLAQYVCASTIHLDLRAMVASSYWALDSVVTALLARSVETAALNRRPLSLAIEVALPPESPAGGYIPHGISVPAVIKFRPSATARKEHYAKVIRDHYDVHTSRDWWPAIEYWVEDIHGVKDELGKMVEARMRVHMDLLLDEIDGGVLRQVDTA
ncbi:hypothetical protein IAU59_005474 [Kwoniella sp. CBS 9459]